MSSAGYHFDRLFTHKRLATTLTNYEATSAESTIASNVAGSRERITHGRLAESVLGRFPSATDTITVAGDETVRAGDVLVDSDGSVRYRVLAVDVEGPPYRADSLTCIVEETL